MPKPPFPIFDGHNDALMSYITPGGVGVERFFLTNTDRHIDWPRARKGGFAGGFFAVFVSEPKSKQMLDDFDSKAVYTLPALDPRTARRMTTTMVANLHRIERISDGRFKVVRTVDELTDCLSTGVMAAILHFEGAEAIDPNLDALEMYYQAGLRSLGIVWSRPTIFGHGVPLQFGHTPDTGPGLTDAGKALVRACNRLGIMIDLSHLNEKGFWDVARLSDAPLVATHSTAFALCPTTRNLTDQQLDAIRESDCMVGLNFVVIFLNEDGSEDTNVPMEILVRHIDYLVDRLGIDRVGLGADLGLPNVPIPRAIGDVGGLPRLIEALQKAGYDDDALCKITHENWIRVLRKTWR